MSEVKQAQEDSKDTRLVTNNGPHNELNLGTAGDADQTAVEDETILGPTQTYHPSLHLIRTPTKRAQQECTPSPEPFHVSTDVTADDEEDEEYEREKLMWETWREDQLIQLRHRIKKLEWEKLCLESRLFPNANDWFRNKRLATAVETKEGGVPKYSNDQPFGGPRLQLQNQMIGREIKRKFKELSSVGMNHPALQAKQTSDAGSNSNKL